MPQHEIDVHGTAPGSPEAIWELLDDSSTWPEWTPIESCVIERSRDAGVNEIRTFKTGRVKVREEVVERLAPRRLSYELLGGLAVRDYRAEIELAPAGAGTEISWHTTFRAKVPGTGWLYRRELEKATRKFVDGLVARRDDSGG